MRFSIFPQFDSTPYDMMDKLTYSLGQGGPPPIQHLGATDHHHSGIPGKDPGRIIHSGTGMRHAYAFGSVGSESVRDGSPENLGIYPAP